VSTEIVERTSLEGSLRSPQFQQQVKLALPGGVTPERFVRIAITALKMNPEIGACDPNSVFNALLRCAADGLVPDGREATLTKFGDKAQYLPMVGGLRKIAAEYGWTMRAAVIYSNDEWQDLGILEPPYHRPAPFGKARGEAIGAVAVGVGPNGRMEWEVFDKAEIEKRRNVSRAKNNGPWVDWWEEMAEKTVIKALFKKLPLGDRDSDRIARIIEASEIEPEEAVGLLYPTSGQQAKVASPELGPGAGTSEVPGGDDEPPPPSSSLGGGALNLELDSAKQITMTSGKFSGLNIGEIADLPGGLDWFLWMLKEDQPRRDDNHAEHLVFLAAERVAKAEHPELFEVLP
jgi:recombination protein RecT